MSETSELFDAHFQRGCEHYNEGDLARAVTEWREASRIDTEDADAHYNVGIALSEIGQPEAAILEWREAIRLEPDHVWTYEHLAHALSEAGQRKEVIQTLKGALQVCPESAALLTSLGYHLMYGPGKERYKAALQEADKALQRAVALEPQNAHVLHLLGVARWWLGRKREGVQFLEASVAADPSDTVALLNLKQLQAEIGDWRGMIRSIDAIAELPMDKNIRQYYNSVNRLWGRLELFASFVIGLAAVFLWLRKRRD